MRGLAWILDPSAKGPLDFLRGGETADGLDRREEQPDRGLDPVVQEELDELEAVTRKLAEIPPAKTASEAPILRELERLRERLLSGDENKDLSALTEQYHNQSAILNQLRSAGDRVQVDASSPYFAHLRLEEEGRRRDLFLGRTTCLGKEACGSSTGGTLLISKIFYGYRQGEVFDEEISGRERYGTVLARRMVRGEKMRPSSGFRRRKATSAWTRRKRRAGEKTR